MYEIKPCDFTESCAMKSDHPGMISGAEISCSIISMLSVRKHGFCRARAAVRPRLAQLPHMVHGRARGACTIAISLSRGRRAAELLLQNFRRSARPSRQRAGVDWQGDITDALRLESSSKWSRPAWVLPARHPDPFLCPCLTAPCARAACARRSDAVTRIDELSLRGAAGRCSTSPSSTRTDRAR